MSGLRLPLRFLLFFLLHLLPTKSRSSTLTTDHPLSITSRSSTISVLKFGAIGDGITFDTVQIQSAIDTISSSGGGTLNFPANYSFLTATVFLKSGVTLEVEEGARIIAGVREEDYPPEQRLWYLVVADRERDVGIKGKGVIDGRGEMFVQRKDPKKNIMVSWNQTGKCDGDECRPKLIGFLDSTDVKVEGINLLQPALWCLHLVRCNDTVIDGVSIHGDFDSPNNDGIDIEDSNNTLITGCKIDTGDDAICPKTSTCPMHNLTARDCWIRTKSSGVKFGSASWFAFKNMLFDNLTIFDSHRGLALQIRDGGDVSDVTFSNIKLRTRYYDPSWWGRAEPIYITTCPRDQSSKAGSISNLQFVNISAVSENGVFMSGSEGAELSDISLNNFNITYQRWTDFAGGLVDYRPGCQGLVQHNNTPGIMMEHVSGFEIRNANMRWSESSFLNGWNNPLQFRSSTVSNLSFLDLNLGI